MSKSNLKMPPILYGTAWKGDKTSFLVQLAIRSGFRGIDTACQPKHYNESGVGHGLNQLISCNFIRREDLFIQTKYTPIDGQDRSKPIPYNELSLLQDQVIQSVQTSLTNLQTSYIDSLVLHSPLPTLEETLNVWRSFENLVTDGIVRFIGISNCYSFSFFEALYKSATIKPFVLQNRFYKKSNYDHQLRQFCDFHKIKYQSFWTLTANPNILDNPIVKKISNNYHMTSEQVFFRFVSNIGIVPLTGTSSENHMIDDLRAVDGSSRLLDTEIASITSLL